MQTSLRVITTPENRVAKEAPERESAPTLLAVVNNEQKAIRGWDAYEVWRRFIRDARARREQIKR